LAATQIFKSQFLSRERDLENPYFERSASALVADAGSTLDRFSLSAFPSIKNLFEVHLLVGRGTPLRIRLLRNWSQSIKVPTAQRRNAFLEHFGKQIQLLEIASFFPL
jgi:hypothetical protein